MKVCTKCQGTFEWKLPYDKTKIPSGDKPCTCGSPKTESKSVTPRVEVPIDTIVDEIIKIKGTMIGKQGEEGKDTKIFLTEAMVEGIWKFAISRKMSR